MFLLFTLLWNKKMNLKIFRQLIKRKWHFIFWEKFNLFAAVLNDYTRNKYVSWGFSTLTRCHREHLILDWQENCQKLLACFIFTPGSSDLVCRNSVLISFCQTCPYKTCKRLSKCVYFLLCTTRRCHFEPWYNK